MQSNEGGSSDASQQFLQVIPLLATLVVLVVGAGMLGRVVDGLGAGDVDDLRHGRAARFVCFVKTSLCCPIAMSSSSLKRSTSWMFTIRSP